jgi:hypothetical protein
MVKRCPGHSPNVFYIYRYFSPNQNFFIMSFFDRLSNGWKISMTSFKVLKQHKQLIVFPLLSGISLLLVMASFIVAIVYSGQWQTQNSWADERVTYYGTLFLFYLVNYFIVVFFNMALIHCARLAFKGEEVSIGKGLEFSLGRIGSILSWSLFAATVGTILRAIQENSGVVGKIITGIIGIVWNIATFFVVPVIAYENLGPVGAFKRSSQLMKQKWGESLGATFSFGIVQVVGILIIALPLYFLGSLINPIAGISLAVLAGFIVISVISAAQTIFVGAVYQSLNNESLEYFDQTMVNDLFTSRK